MSPPCSRSMPTCRTHRSAPASRTSGRLASVYRGVPLEWSSPLSCWPPSPTVRPSDVPPLPRIRSLAYFQPVIEELLEHPVPDDYLDTCGSSSAASSITPPRPKSKKLRFQMIANTRFATSRKRCRTAGADMGPVLRVNLVSEVQWFAAAQQRLVPPAGPPRQLGFPARHSGSAGAQEPLLGCVTYISPAVAGRAILPESQ